MARMKKRAEFLAAARARKQAVPGFVLQYRDRGDGGPPRVGFTASKKVGNAVARNRAKRRLRAVVAAHLSDLARPGGDYVLIARAGATAARPWLDLQADLKAATASVHAPRKPKSPRHRRETPGHSDHAGHTESRDASKLISGGPSDPPRGG